MKRREFLTGLGAGALGTGMLMAGAGTAWAEGAAIDEIRRRGALRAGLATFVPWAMRDKQGALIGYEIDVATRLSRDLGVKYEPVPTAWDGIIPALIAGSFDVIIGGMTVTPQRAQTVDFTDGYSFSGIGIAASKKTAPGLTSIEAFNRPDITLTARRGSTAAQAAQQKMPLATLRQFDDDAPALQEVLNGNAQATLASTPKPAFAVLDHPDDLYAPVTGAFVNSVDAMAVRKGDGATLTVLNGWIAARKADGWLAERFHYWFEGRDWRAQVAA